MSMEEEFKLLEACAIPRFLSQIVPLVGVPERRCRDLFQSLRKRGLVRLVLRRWVRTRSGVRYMEELREAIRRKEEEAEAERRRVRERAAALRERLLGRGPAAPA